MPRALLSAVLACALALTLSACGSTTTSANFKGSQHEAAQALANLQSAATAGEGSKICADDLARKIVAALHGAKQCEAAIKHQLAQVDNLEVKIESVKLAANGKSASAIVKSIYYGKNKLESVSLVKEGGSWKVAAP
jgi:hypothetical protein